MQNLISVALRVRAMYYRYLSTPMHTPVYTSETPIHDQLEREWAALWSAK